jgi:hypothetical protein
MLARAWECIRPDTEIFQRRAIRHSTCATMIVLPTAESPDESRPNTWSATHRRHYRGRNHLITEVIDWHSGTPLPADPPYWDDMFGSSIRVGIMAARKTFKPALVVWTVMAGIAALYY